jgi:SAM-dependent methyltransferase
MMSNSSLHPYGLAILDYFNGNTSAAITAVDDLGHKREVPVSLFFREFDDFPALEKKAIELCFGKVLDIGAGAGRHSLALQQRGHTVCALDIVPDCVTVMKRRGVHEAHCADILEFDGGPYDTLLGAMNGLTMVRSLDRLPMFLQNIRRLIGPKGQYLVDSTDVRRWTKSDMNPLFETKLRDGQYFGELTVRVEYKDSSATLPELYVDQETLCDHALKTGWDCEIVMEQDNGRYLARLTPLQL